MVPLVSIVIPNWNGLRFLEECLVSVSEQKFRGAEVIVVDNGSRDGSAPWVSRRFPQVRLIRNVRNLGFAAAVNQGFRAGLGAYLVALNNDTRVDPGWLDHLIEPLEREACVGAACSRVVFYHNPGCVYNAGIRITPLGEPRNLGYGEPVQRFSRPCRVDGACACSAAYRKSALQDVGLFDERFVSYHEDVDLSWRLRKMGWDIVYVPASVVRHHGSGSTGHLSPLARRHSAKNLLLMNLKNGSLGHILFHAATCAFRYGGALRHPAFLRETLRLMPAVLWERARKGFGNSGRSPWRFDFRR